MPDKEGMLNKQEGRRVLDILTNAGRRVGIIEVDENETKLMEELAWKIVVEKGPEAMSDFQDLLKADSAGLEYNKDYLMAYILDHAQDPAVRAAAFKYVSQRAKEEPNYGFSEFYAGAIRRYQTGETLPPINPAESAAVDAKIKEIINPITRLKK